MKKDFGTAGVFGAEEGWVNTDRVLTPAMQARFKLRKENDKIYSKGVQKAKARKTVNPMFGISPTKQNPMFDGRGHENENSGYLVVQDNAC
jgi:hypothetical protein